MALHTTQARVTLCADINSVSRLDTTLDSAAYTYSSINNLVADTTYIWRWLLQIDSAFA
jgi:hypothetical protein